MRPPAGHSEKAEDWADTRTINSMVELARNGHSDWSEFTENMLGLVPFGAASLGEIPDIDPAIALPEYSAGPRGILGCHWGIADIPLNLDRGKPEKVNNLLRLKVEF